MTVPESTDQHDRRVRIVWLSRRRRRGRGAGRRRGTEPMPMGHRDLKEKIRRETKGKSPAEEARILERYLRDWPEFKGPYQEMRKKYEKRIANAGGKAKKASKGVVNFRQELVKLVIICKLSRS